MSSASRSFPSRSFPGRRPRPEYVLADQRRNRADVGRDRAGVDGRKGPLTARSRSAGSWRTSSAKGRSRPIERFRRGSTTSRSSDTAPPESCSSRTSPGSPPAPGSRAREPLTTPRSWRCMRHLAAAIPDGCRRRQRLRSSLLRDRAPGGAAGGRRARRERRRDRPRPRRAPHCAAAQGAGLPRDRARCRSTSNFDLARALAVTTACRAPRCGPRRRVVHAGARNGRRDPITASTKSNQPVELALEFARPRSSSSSSARSGMEFPRVAVL